MTLENKMKGQINTFYWIAALSVINSIVSLTGGKISFVVGLGFTQFIDAVSIKLAEKASSPAGPVIRVVGVALDILFAGLFFLFGYLGHKKYQSAVIAGIVLYALDAVLWLVFKDWFAVLFHVWMLALLTQGAVSINKWKKLQETQPQSHPSMIQTGESVFPEAKVITPENNPVILAKKMLSLENKIKAGIASISAIGLFSLINTFVFSAGGKVSFVVGLGVTQLIDGFLKQGSWASSGNSMIAFLLDLGISVGFMQLGRMAKKRTKNILLTSLILYGLDTVIFVFTQTWIGLLFHLFFLYGLWTGYRALCEWETIEKNTLADVLIPARDMATRAATPEKKEPTPASKKNFKIFLISLAVIFFLTPVITYILLLIFK